jgi:hypothetical protein
MPWPRFTLGEKATSTHCIGGWVGPEPVWMQRLEEKSSTSAGDRTPAVQSIVRHYTDWATWLTPESGTAIISTVLLHDEHLSQTNPSCIQIFCYLLAHFTLTWYFLVRICTTELFMNSNKSFQSEVQSDNEHMFCSWIHHGCTCIAFIQLAWAVVLQPWWPWLECHREFCKSLLQGVGPASDFIFVLQYIIVFVF